MSNKNFDKLASSLTESEKKSLLNQISENLTSNPIEGDQQYSSFKEKENKNFKVKSLKKDVEEMGFFQRLILTIRGFVTGKDVLEVHNSDLLQNIERRILYTSPTLVNTKKRRFSSILINDFLTINSLVLPFVKPFSEVWENPLALERMISSIIAEKYAGVKTDLQDFMRESEIDKYIASGEELDGVKKHLLRAVYDYRKKIPDYTFPEAEEELLSLISLKNIVLYNFAPMFKLMGISSGDSFTSVSDKSVSMGLVVKHLEEFYKLIIHFSGTSIKKTTMGALINQAPEVEGESDERLWDYYKNLSDKLKNMTVVYPFEDLVKFARNNPFYKIDFTIQKINVADFYFTTLKKEVVSSLDEIFKTREKSVVTDMFDDMFKNHKKVILHNYALHKEFDPTRLGLNYFKYIECAEIMVNYIKHYYLREFKDIVFVLSRHIFEKNHMLQSRSLELSIGFETLWERLLKFDRSLSPDTEVGKTMRTLFNSVASNRQNIRMYKAFIKQKDEDMLDLLKSGTKLITDLEKLLIQTLKSPADSVRLQVSAIHPSISRKKTLKDVLIEKTNEIKSFLDIFNKKIVFDS